MSEATQGAGGGRERTREVVEEGNVLVRVPGLLVECDGFGEVALLVLRVPLELELVRSGGSVHFVFSKAKERIRVSALPLTRQSSWLAQSPTGTRR